MTESQAPENDGTIEQGSRPMARSGTWYELVIVAAVVLAAAATTAVFGRALPAIDGNPATIAESKSQRTRERSSPAVAGAISINPSAVGPRDALLDGWEDAPNDTASWTVGHSSNVGVRLTCTEGDRVKVTLTSVQWIGAFVPGSAPISVEFRWNGETFDSFKVPTDGFVLDGEVPADSVRCGGNNIFEIYVPNPLRPSDGDADNNDKRLLGLAVSDILLQVLPAK
ncbi:MAG: hypothetical protein EOP84_02395 [Verrucomicrobiaceae bacterium]|nr:MAG: hypothetical protein EOP84_02395 [Verrucomicrobiaceae bacterium]